MDENRGWILCVIPLHVAAKTWCRVDTDMMAAGRVLVGPAPCMYQPEYRVGHLRDVYIHADYKQRDVLALYCNTVYQNYLMTGQIVKQHSEYLLQVVSGVRYYIKLLFTFLVKADIS